MWQDYYQRNTSIIISVVLHIVVIFYVPIHLIRPLITDTPASEPQQTPLSINIVGDLTTQTGGKSPVSAEKGSSDSHFNVDQQKWGALLERLEENSALADNYDSVIEDLLPEHNVADAYINRNRHNEDIVVKEVFPTIHNIEKDFSEILNAAPQKLRDHNERNEIIRQYRQWKRGESATNNLVISQTKDNGANVSSPLEFPKSQRTTYFDDTLALPKNIQLNNFINEYFNYDPNEGDLPIATRELYYDNLQRIAYRFSADPTYLHLDYFFENLNKEDFLKNSLQQAARLDATKTQTELLFAIEDIYHIQQRAWRYYFDFERIYQGLPDTKKNQLRVETLRRVFERYQEVLEQKDISSYADIQKLYTQKRLQIMDYVLSNSPNDYRSNDAAYTQALINWQDGVINDSIEKKVLAANQWLSIVPSAQSSESDEDFASQETLLQLTPLLRDYLASDTIQRRKLQALIQNALYLQHQPRLQAKQEREAKLLWNN